MRRLLSFALVSLFALTTKAQTDKKQLILLFPISEPRPAMVDFDSYEKLIKEVKQHRKSRLVTLDTFMAMSQQPNVVILDTRSDSMYNAKHIKGAIHLNFSDFNIYSLARLVPDRNTKILIYCNNNFTNDQRYFITKAAQRQNPREQPLTLALNIPTYINLYGYGYRNVYELSQAVSVNDPRLVFEGTAIKPKQAELASNAGN